MNPIRKIMLLLFLLVGLSVLGMWIMSEVNLRHAKQAISEQHNAFLEQAFNTHYDRIDASLHYIEHRTDELANLGQLWYQLHLEHPNTLSAQTWQNLLTQQLSNTPESLGSGIWFAPELNQGKPDFGGVYTTWDKKKPYSQFFKDAQFNYFDQPFYQAVNEQNTDKIGKKYFWTAAYLHPLLQRESDQQMVISLSVPLFDAQKRFIGIASSDWDAMAITQLINDINVTPNAVAFLIDEKNPKLSLSNKKPFFSSKLLPLLNTQVLLTSPQPQHFNRGTMQRRVIEIEQHAYHLYTAPISSDKVFGISVPKDEMNIAIHAMRWFNQKILFFTMLIFIILAIIILLVVSGIIRLLDTLYTDSLTKQPNRNRLLQALPAQNPYGLILLNIDNFKEINDFYGSACGDHVLLDFTQRLQAFLLHEPVPKPINLYKMPADEWALLLEKQSSFLQLQRFLGSLANFSDMQNFHWEEQEVNINVTLSAATRDNIHASQHETLLSAANMALKTARLQKKRTIVYTPALQVRETYEQNLLWAKQLKIAMTHDRLVPFFQPIINTQSGKIEKYECLLRMLDADNQWVLPYKFLNIAKKLRLYPQITRIVVEKSFAIFQHLPYGLSINLSYEDLSNPETVTFIYQALKQYNIAERVFFEILESESIANYTVALDFINHVKAMGSRISIDDFGSGYSNFEHLLRLHVDVIKIDGSLVRNIDKDPNAFIVTQGIVNFAHSLHLKTVAEFVHTETILEKVAELGVDYAQGFYIGRPQDAL